LPVFRLDELDSNDKALRLGEPNHGSPLGLDAEARAALAFDRDAVVGDGWLHVGTILRVLHKSHYGFVQRS
jgi:hypothetical protein